MALTIDTKNSQSSICHEEYLSYLDAKIPPSDIDGIIETAPEFAKLANDRCLLTNNLNEYLKGIIDSGAQYELGTQSFLLGARGCYILRFNVWLPLQSQNLTTDQERLEKEIYSFDFAHDHNFDFLTVGYLGSGYKTRIYEYDRSRVKGYLGEKVESNFLEETTLPEKKLMMYRAMKDIHTQFLPEEFSVSINLLITNLDYLIEPQYVFNSKIDRIEGMVKQSRLSSIYFMIPVARHVGDQNTAQLLEDICLSASMPDIIKAESVNALNCIAGEAAAIDTLQKIEVATKGGIFDHTVAIGYEN